MNICIVGLGYVGLPLAIQFARSGVQVVGLDIDTAKADAINEGRSYIKHIAAETIQETLQANLLSASTDFGSQFSCLRAFDGSPINSSTSTGR